MLPAAETNCSAARAAADIVYSLVQQLAIMYTSQIAAKGHCLHTRGPHTSNTVSFLVLSRSTGLAHTSPVHSQAQSARQQQGTHAGFVRCRAAALQFDSKVFEAERVDFAGAEEYIYRGGRDKFKLLKKVPVSDSASNRRSRCAISFNLHMLMPFTDQLAASEAMDLS